MGPTPEWIPSPELFSSSSLVPPGVHPLAYFIAYAFPYVALIVLGTNLLSLLLYQALSFFRQPRFNLRKQFLVSTGGILLYFAVTLALGAL